MGLAGIAKGALCSAVEWKHEAARSSAQRADFPSVITLASGPCLGLLGGTMLRQGTAVKNSDREFKPLQKGGLV